MRFDCACTDNGGFRCSLHAPYPCHDPEVHDSTYRYYDPDRECPPCFIARLRSVSLSPKATPTRRGAA